MIDTFRMIPANGETRSLSGLTFKEFAAGRATLSDWILSGMKEIADDADKYHPMPYAPMPGQVRGYAEKRVSGQIQHVEQSSRELSAWALDAFRRLDRNNVDLETLSHAHSRSVGIDLLKSGVPRLERAITRFMNRVAPHADMDLAQRALALDSDFRRARVRESSK
jgi:hypothetical protein